MSDVERGGPTEPRSIPDPLREQLERQDESTLQDVVRYAEELMGDSTDEPVRSDTVRGELAEWEEFTEQVRRFVRQHCALGHPVYVTKWRRGCDDGCPSCPHGSYFMGIWEENGRKRRKWLDRVPDGK